MFRVIRQHKSAASPRLVTYCGESLREWAREHAFVIPVGSLKRDVCVDFPPEFEGKPVRIAPEVARRRRDSPEGNVTVRLARA